jgi:hypothetical protein
MGVGESVNQQDARVRVERAPCIESTIRKRMTPPAGHGIFTQAFAAQDLVVYNFYKKTFLNRLFKGFFDVTFKFFARNGAQNLNYCIGRN